MPPISTVLITRNEAANIVRTLTAVQQVCDDVVVVDSGSMDDTVVLCRKMGARVFEYGWEGYSKNKNYGAAQARHDWVLSIDADEVLSPELILSLKNFQPQAETVYALDRITNFCGAWIRYSGWYPDWKVRLYDRNVVFWEGDFVHETLHIPARFGIERLHGKLYHYSYTSHADHLERIERYAQLSAQKMFVAGKKATFSKRWFSPVFRFFRTYVLKKGFLDGKNGWIISRRNAYMVYRKYRLLKTLWNDKPTS